MPRVDGLAVLRELRGRPDAPPVLVLTTFDDTDLVLEAIRSGARGYLLKDVTLEHLMTAIRTLASGGTMIQPFWPPTGVRSGVPRPGRTSSCCSRT